MFDSFHGVRLSKKEKKMSEVIHNMGFQFFWNHIPTVWGKTPESQVFRFYVVMTYRDKTVLESKFTIGKGFANKTDDCPKATALCCTWGKFPTFNPVSFLHSIYSDSQAFSQTFQEFCDNFGYDIDSLQAKKIFKKCWKIGSAFSRLVPIENRNKLDILFQDY